MAGGVRRNNNPRLALASAECVEDAKTQCNLLKTDHWFARGHETTRTSVELCQTHADQYFEYTEKWQCQHPGRYDNGLETRHDGGGKQLRRHHFSEMIMGRTGEPERIPASSENGKDSPVTKTTAPHRDSAPPVLQAVRGLNEKVSQPQAEEMKRMLKAYSFDDDDVSDDEQPSSVLKTTKKKRYAKSLPSCRTRKDSLKQNQRLNEGNVAKRHEIRCGTLEQWSSLMIAVWKKRQRMRKVGW